MNSNIVEVEFVRKNGTISVAGLNHYIGNAETRALTMLPSIIAVEQAAITAVMIGINVPRVGDDLLALTRFTNF